MPAPEIGVRTVQRPAIRVSVRDGKESACQRARLIGVAEADDHVERH
ncbi:hypothetical protein [Actinoplanes sp. NPDC051859]